MVSWAEPGAVTGLGEAVADAPAGRPATTTETGPAKPPTDVTDTVTVTRWPRVTEAAAGLTETPKSRGVTWSTTLAVCVTPPAVPTTVSGYEPGAALGSVETDTVAVPAVLTLA